ncbi:polynucleotide kinase-phosphatase, partial [bacterium]
MVVLIGASGSGKSTFAKRHFAEYEILSSDFCRALASDDENDQGATKDAFEILHFIANKRLENYRTVAIDATNVQEGARKPLIAMARANDLFPIAVVLNVPPRTCLERNQDRPDRQFGEHVVHRQFADLRRAIKNLRREGFRHIHVLDPEGIEEVEFVRTPLYSVKPEEHGPFDIIGDIHGCLDETHALLASLGYTMEEGVPRHPEGRRLVFLGDLVDRGPDSPGVLRLVMRAVAEAGAICVPG